MSRSNSRTNSRKSSKRGGASPRCGQLRETVDLADASERIAGQKWFDLAIVLILLGFGIYQSVIYFGHRVVPDPDFFEFVASGKQLWSFELPEKFKRAPVVGFLQVGLGRVFGGEHPSMTGARVLNAIVHPLSLVLLWLVGKRLIKEWAGFFAIISILNPYVLNLLGRVIAEPTLIFFTLLTFYFIFRRSRWSYVFAAITTMVRYEGAALILIATLTDLGQSKNNRQRVGALLRGGAAALPLALWLLGTYLTLQPGQSHYVGNYGHGTVFLKFWRLFWEATFMPLFLQWQGRAIGTSYTISAILVLAGFVLGIVYAVIKRDDRAGGVILFCVLYFLIHSLRADTQHRYCTPVSWAVLLVWWYGLLNVTQTIHRRISVQPWAGCVFQTALLAAALIWLGMYVPVFRHESIIKGLRKMSTASRHLPYVAMCVVASILSVRLLFTSGRKWLYWLSVSSVICVMIVSNHYEVTRLVKNGLKYAEYKYLADWYVSQSDHEGKLACERSYLSRFFAPEYGDKFFWMGSLSQDSPSEFVRDCRKRGVRYIAWIFYLPRLDKKSFEARLLNVSDVKTVKRRRDVGPLKLVKQFNGGEGQFVKVYRLSRQEQ